jgi:hypothetical protein
MSDDAPRAVPASALVHVQSCDDTLAARKLAALRAHASQTGELIKRLGESTITHWWSQEAFAPAR